MKKREDSRPPGKGGERDPSGKKPKTAAEFPGGEENAAGKSNPSGKDEEYGSKPVRSEDINRGEKNK